MRRRVSQAGRTAMELHRVDTEYWLHEGRELCFVQSRTK